jgi:serine/threonine-protein kinase
MATNKIGHYTIVSELGRGGMGVVYKAHEESLNRYVAIKVLGEHLSEDPSFVTRFVREAQAAAALSHPNIIQIFFIGEDNGRHYFVMEYVDGQSLLAMVRKEGRIENPRAAQYMLQAANGLAAAHDKGFLHRDIKPANLMVNDRGLLKIADFGLALPQDAATRLTATGMLVGTPGYLSPEQCMGQQVDKRTDIYSLGVTYYELLTGTMPFQADSPLALLRKILQEEPPEITTLNQAVDDETRRIVNRMIVKDREQRYSSCHELASDLDAFLASRGARSAAGGFAGTGVAAPAAAGASMSGKTERISGSGAPPPLAPAPASGPAAPPPVVAAATSPLPNPPVPAPAAMVPAPQAAPVPVPAPAAKKSRAAVIVLGVVALFVVGVAVAGYLALRSPLVKRFLPWGGKATVARQEEKGAPASGALAGTGGETRAEGAGAPVQGGQQGAAAAGEPAVQPPAQPKAPPVMAQGGTRGASHTAGSAGRAAAPARAPAAGAGAESAVPALGGVAVAVVGDQMLVGPVASFLQSELQTAGLQPLDASTLPVTEALLRGQADPGADGLMQALRGERLAVLVLARVVPAGQRQLKYMNRYDTAYSSRVTLTCYDLATGRPKGRSLSATVEFTTLTTERATEKALGPLVEEIAKQAR